MCEILNVHVQKVDNGMGLIPVSRFLPLDFFKKFLFHVTSDKFLLLHSLPLNYLLNQMLYNQIIM